MIIWHAGSDLSTGGTERIQIWGAIRVGSIEAGDGNDALDGGRMDMMR